MTREEPEAPRRRLPRSFYLLLAGHTVTLVECDVMLVVPADGNRTSQPEHERDWVLRVCGGTPYPTGVCSPDSRRHRQARFMLKRLLRVVLPKLIDRLSLTAAATGSAAMRSAVGAFLARAAARELSLVSVLRRARLSSSAPFPSSQTGTPLHAH